MKKLWILVGVIIICVILYPWVREQKVVRQTLDPDTWMCAPNKQAKAPKMSWDAAQKIVSTQALYEDLLQLSDDPLWQSCSADYLRGVAKRREHAMAFSKQNQPTIVFIGNSHGTAEVRSNTRSDPKEGKRVLLHTATSVRLVVEDPDVDLFVFELEGPLEPLTRQGILDDLAARGKKIYDGSNMDPLPLESIFKYAPEAYFRIVDQRPDIRVVPGEECLLPLAASLVVRSEARLVEIGAAETRRTADCQTKIYMAMIRRIAVLRTEVAVIRALELLEKFGGNKAVIQQGVLHIPDFEAVQAIYKFPALSYDLKKIEASAGSNL